MLEIVIGHCTVCGPVRRPRLSVFSAVYSLIANSRGNQEPLWKSCRAELEAFIGLIPLLYNSWAMPWCSTVYCFD